MKRLITVFLSLFIFLYSSYSQGLRIPDYNPSQKSNSQLQNRVIVNQSNASSIFAGSLDATKEYFIDGVVDLTGLSVSIEVPAAGLTIEGYSFDLSKLICSDNSYTMFTSPVSGSGDLLKMDLAIEVTGTNSQVYNIVSATGNDAFEMSRVNFNECTSLGTIDNYRQGLESGTGRFGGSPSLTLKGAWAGGYFIETSIIRGMSNTTTEPIYKAGAGFSMASRFRTNQNVDLGSLQPFCDFSQSNFPNPSTLDVDGARITRNGVTNAEDLNIFPNISAGDLVCIWKDNQGMPNTFIGGRGDITTEAATPIAVAGDFYTLLGTFTSVNLQHFDNPSNGQFRHLGENPREFKVICDLILDSNPNNELTVRVKKWDNSASSFVTVFDQRRQVNSLIGFRDVAFFTVITDVTLDRNDYVFLEVANNSDTNSITAELGSFIEMNER